MADRLRLEVVDDMLEYQPAPRRIYYVLNASGITELLLGRHYSGRLTLPGGRFDPRYDLGERNLLRSLFNKTLPREIKEETGELGLPEGSVSMDVGIVFWRHPKTSRVRLDLLTAVRCSVRPRISRPHTSELMALEWHGLEYILKDPKGLFPHILLGLQLFQDVNVKAKPANLNNIAFDPAIISSHEIDDLRKQLELLLLQPIET